MKELQIILKKLSQFAPDEKAILATVVDVQGSSYRLPGARMLISETGEMFGTVSGGCLESDVLERARHVLKNNQPTVLTYDTTDKTDSVFSLNMGCNGIIRILLEPVTAGSDLFKAWRLALEHRERQTVATIVSSNADLPVGGRAFYSQTKRFEFNGAPNFLESYREFLDNCAGFFEDGADSQIREIYVGENKIEVFFENVTPPLNLIIFGAGYDAIPVANLAKNLGWRVTIVDHRPAFATRERFSQADELFVLRPAALPAEIVFDANSAAVIMTHNYSIDREILKFLSAQPLAYTGALGPKRRTENLLQELRAEKVNFSETQLNRLYAPVGLDIGAADPESIALSIVAEIQSVLANRTGGFLRARQGSIYNRD